MPETSASLLDRCRSGADPGSWRELTEVYSPIISTWIRGHAVYDSDNDDLVQEILLIVLRKLPGFEHNRRRGAFRNWLRAITANCLQRFWHEERLLPRASAGNDFDRLLADLQEPASEISRQWDREHDLQVMHQLMELVRPEFEETTWQAFDQTALQARTASHVAAELGISTNAVYIAKSRVLTRLRQMSEGLVD